MHAVITLMNIDAFNSLQFKLLIHLSLILFLLLIEVFVTAVQHERGPRNSTLRRQMALYFKEGDPGPSAPPPPVLDLALPKVTSSTSSPPRPHPPTHLLSSPIPTPYAFASPLPKVTLTFSLPLLVN